MLFCFHFLLCHNIPLIPLIKKKKKNRLFCLSTFFPFSNYLCMELNTKVCLHECKNVQGGIQDIPQKKEELKIRGGDNIKKDFLFLRFFHSLVSNNFILQI